MDLQAADCHQTAAHPSKARSQEALSSALVEYQLTVRNKSFRKKPGLLCRQVEKGTKTARDGFRHPAWRSAWLR